MTVKNPQIFLSLLLSLLITGCGSRVIPLDLPPTGVDISGTWQFMTQDEDSYRDFQQRAQFASTRALTSLKPAMTTSATGQRRRTQASKDLPNHMLLDMVLSLVSLPINELYIEQKRNNLAIDYGVAGYHSFDLAKKNELLIGGAELESTAGWKDGQMVIQMVVTERFQIVQKFRPMDGSNLLETLTVRIGEKESISHQRWYSKKN